MLTYAQACEASPDQVLEVVSTPSDHGSLARFPALEHAIFTGFGALPDASCLAASDVASVTLAGFEGELDGKAIERWLSSLAKLTQLTLRGTRLKRGEHLASLRALRALVLDDVGVTQIPEPLLEHLDVLSLPRNRIGALPPPPPRSRIRELDLSSNKLAELPPDWLRLETLRSLNVSGNKLRALPAVSGAPLEHLDVGANALSSLPDEISTWPLRTLGLARLGVRSLPLAVCRLVMLEALDLRHSPLSKLPEQLGDLVRLRSFEMSGPARASRGLSRLPSRFTELRALRRLCLGGNILDELPADLGALSELEVLELANVRIVALPESIGALRHLRELRLDTHQLRRSFDGASHPPLRVPGSLFSCTGLEVLELASGMLPQVPEAIGQLSGLRALQLGHNALESLPESVGTLGRLEILDVSNNRIADLSGIAFDALPALRTLDVSHNRLTELPGTLASSRPDRFASLSVHGNPIAVVPEWIHRQTRLHTLDLRQTAVRERPLGLRPDVTVYL